MTHFERCNLGPYRTVVTPFGLISLGKVWLRGLATR
jgi:hypothetical protein